MVLNFSSVGDIISVSLLVKDILLALDDARGSASEYQAVIRELHILDIALLRVQKLVQTQHNSPEIEALHETARKTVENCRESVSKFVEGIKKYKKSLADGGSGNILKDTARKLQWKIAAKDEDVAKFRAEVMGYSESLNMLLATAQLTSFQIIGSDVKAQAIDTNRALNQQSVSLLEISTRLEENERLVSSGNSLIAKLAERVDWVKNLAIELKRYMHQIMAGNLAIYREVLAIQSSFAARVDRNLCEDPFILEDAIGRIAPVHLRFISSWQAFDAVMEIRFQGKQGLTKIEKKEYVLQETATKSEISRSVEFSDAFLPGQKISMALIFKKESNSAASKSDPQCPRCQKTSKESADADILCTNCNMWFRRIQEIYDVDPPKVVISNHWSKPAQFGENSFSGVTFGPVAPKRKLEDYDGEDGDFTRFKRIRMISQHKRVKVPKIFKSSASFRSFGDLQYNEIRLNSQPSSPVNSDDSVYHTNTVHKLKENIAWDDFNNWQPFNAHAISRATSNNGYQQRSHSPEGSNPQTYPPLPPLPSEFQLLPGPTPLKVNVLKHESALPVEPVYPIQTPGAYQPVYPANPFPGPPQHYVQYETFPARIYFPISEYDHFPTVKQGLHWIMAKDMEKEHTCAATYLHFPIRAPISGVITVSSLCVHDVHCSPFEEPDFGSVSCSRGNCPLTAWISKCDYVPLIDVTPLDKINYSDLKSYMAEHLPAYFILPYVLLGNIPPRVHWQSEFAGEFSLFLVEDRRCSESARKLGPFEQPLSLLRDLEGAGKSPMLAYSYTRYPENLDHIYQ